MADLLESLLLKKTDLTPILNWLKNDEEGDSLEVRKSGVRVLKQEFVPFLLNFLREQSSQALTHGPATPAKTPSRSRPASQRHGHSSKKSWRTAGSGTGTRSTSRVQLFSPASSVSPGSEWDASSQSGIHYLHSRFSSPSLNTASRSSGPERRSGLGVILADFVPSADSDISLSVNVGSQKSRRKSGGSTLRAQGRPVGGRGRHRSDESGGRKPGKGGGGGYILPQAHISPPSVEPLNLSNLEDFPPVGSSSPLIPAESILRRRINPTRVSTERPRSKPHACFTSTPFSRTSPTCVDSLIPTETLLTDLDDSESLLNRRMQSALVLTPGPAKQVCSPLPSLPDLCTPTKSGPSGGSKVTPDMQKPQPKPSKVTFSLELDLLAELYCTCISENLVPNIFLEVFFMMQLLTSQSPNTHDDDDDDDDEEEEEDHESLCTENSDVLQRSYLRQVHNCVYFAVKVLESQFQLLSNLDKCTLRLLAENERVASFSPSFRDSLTLALDKSTAQLSPLVSTFIYSVPFQPATDNRSNFCSDKAFHTFKKQRDIFYEVLREWEDCHADPGWSFDAVLGGKIRGIMSQLTSAGNHSHFARLFLKQLTQMCKGPRMNSSPGDAPDAYLLGMLGSDSLGRLRRLEERLIQPHKVVGPCPPPSFPGHQEFFRDFLQTACCCQLNQHLQDSLCQQLLQLDEVSILSPCTSVREGEGGGDDDGDMEQQDEQQRFTSVLLLARLLAKFLGFISFLPYQTSETPSGELKEAAVALRSKSVPVLDVCALLRNSVRRKRTILTVPWMVEFLSMLDCIGPWLLCYRTALGILLLLYRKMLLGRCGEMCYLNKLLMVSVLGWLFQIPVIPEDIFFTNEFTQVAELDDSSATAAGLDCIPLVDQQLLYTCCPFLEEFRKLLAAFVSGSTSKSGGIIRKITPTSAELRDATSVNRSQQKLQVELEQAFFHNQPPSLRRTVEFVAERVGSNAVKHMKATFVNELVERGEKKLRDGLKSTNSTHFELRDSICAELCAMGLEALPKATRFCSEKSPKAVQTLLSEETSPAVLSTSENITKCLATEKARSWLSANITALIRREWKSRFDRVMKTMESSVAPDSADSEEAAGGLVPLEQSTTPKRKAGHVTAASCPPQCTHSASLPSDMLIEMKELLSIAVGPRTDEELPAASEILALLQRVEETLACRKFSTAVSQQMLLNCTVQLALKLVFAELPLSDRGEHVLFPIPRRLWAGHVRPVLHYLVNLWKNQPCSSVPLHLLFSPHVKTLRDNSTSCSNYNFLVLELLNSGMLTDEQIALLDPFISDEETIWDSFLLEEEEEEILFWNFGVKLSCRSHRGL